MAVILYKPGKTHIVRGIKCTLQKVDETLFRNEVKAGWKLSPEECYETQEETTEEETTEEIEEETKPPLTVGHLDLDSLSDDDIRATAQQASIKNWHVKSIVNLKKELEGNAS